MINGKDIVTVAFIEWLHCEKHYYLATVCQGSTMGSSDVIPIASLGIKISDLWEEYQATPAPGVQIKVAVRYFYDSSPYLTVTNPAHRHCVAIPLEPVPPVMRAEAAWKNDEAFVFQDIPATVHSTIGTLPSYVVRPESLWHICLLELKPEGFIFHPKERTIDEPTI